MSEYISIQLPNKDCKGMFLLADSDVKAVTSVSEANKLVGKTFKIQLRTRVDGKMGKKTFSFHSSKTTFLKAVEEVAGKRAGIRSDIKSNGTTREIKVEDEVVDNRIFYNEIEQFLLTKSIEVRENTIEVYKTALYVYSKPLFDMSIDKIQIKDIQQIVGELTKQRAPATIQLYVRTLRVFLKEFKAPVTLEWNNLKLPEVDNVRKYTLKLQDTKKIIAFMRAYSGTSIEGETYYLYEEVRNVFIFLLTGRRINEVLSLKYTDIDFDNKTFSIPSSRVKSKSELKFNIDDDLMNVIESQARLNNIDLKDELPNKLLFSYCNETIRYHFQNLLVAMGLPKLRLHDIRHMLASTLIQNEVAIADVSVMLGHSSIQTTEKRYTNKSPDQASRATNALNDILKG